MSIKRCSRCREDKPFSEFYKANSSTAKHGLQAYCKDCTRESLRIYRETRPTRQTEYDRNRQLTIKFGITLEEYNDILDAQAYECAICSIDIENVSKDFAVDHDHVTGKVRGLLCSNCNSGLGQFKDSIVFLQKAIEYLQKNGEL